VDVAGITMGVKDGLFVGWELISTETVGVESAVIIDNVDVANVFFTSVFINVGVVVVLYALNASDGENPVVAIGLFNTTGSNVVDSPVITVLSTNIMQPPTMKKAPARSQYFALSKRHAK